MLNYWSSGAMVSVPACHAGGCGFESRLDRHGSVAQSVEQWIENPCVGGSIPPGTTISTRQYAGLAQLVEHLTCNQRVEGSNPLAGTSSCRSGGIGRHAGFKILWELIPYRFKSGLRYHLN